MELTLKEIEFQKINLQPGETLVVKLKGNAFTESPEQNQRFLESLNKGFPGNKVMLLVVPDGSDIEFSAINENKENSSCNTGQFCADCNCGKKEQFGGNNG